MLGSFMRHLSSNDSDDLEGQGEAQEEDRYNVVVNYMNRVLGHAAPFVAFAGSAAVLFLFAVAGRGASDAMTSSSSSSSATPSGSSSSNRGDGALLSLLISLLLVSCVALFCIRTVRILHARQANSRGPLPLPNALTHMLFAHAASIYDRRSSPSGYNADNQFVNFMNIAMTNRDFTSADFEMLQSLDEGNSSRGATEAQLRSLPVHVQQEARGAGADDGADGVCSVCLEPYEKGQRVKSAPCLHRFHESCLDKWLVEKPSCPICKNDCF